MDHYDIKEEYTLKTVQCAPFSEYDNEGNSYHTECPICFEYTLKMCVPDCHKDHFICLECSKAIEVCPFCNKDINNINYYLFIFGKRILVLKNKNIKLKINYYHGWDFWEKKRNISQTSKIVNIKDMCIYDYNKKIIIIKLEDNEYFSCGSGPTLSSRIYGIDKDGKFYYYDNNSFITWPDKYPPAWQDIYVE